MNNLNNLTFKQAKSLNNKHIKDLDNGVTPATDYIYLKDLVTDYLKTDDDLPVKFKILFHLQNPNGLVHQLPTFNDVADTRDGQTYVNSFQFCNTKYRNIWAKKLVKWAYASKKPTKIDLSVCLNSLRRDVDDYTVWKPNKQDWFDKAFQNKETA
jgi:hypothetical protein